MLIEWLYELKESIDKHGIRFGLIFALYAIYRKERRNSRLDQRDADIFHNQRVIMEKLGVDSEWRGQASPFQSEEVKSLRKLLQSSQAALKRVHQQRRVIKMDQSNINWISLIPAVAGAIKLILQPFGIDLSHITDTQVNDIANGAAALATVIGIFMSHRKKPTQNGGTVNEPTQRTGDSGSAV
jgi:uncharacterized membrane protein